MGDMVPPMVGGDMVAATSPGTMYDGSSSVTGLSEIKNPDQVDQLEGQAFYAVMAPMQYTLQTTSTTWAVQKARADKQKVCAETLLQILVMSRTGSDTSTCQGLKDCDVAAGAAPNTAPFATTSCVNNNPAAGTAIADVLLDRQHIAEIQKYQDDENLKIKIAEEKSKSFAVK